MFNLFFQSFEHCLMSHAFIDNDKDTTRQEDERGGNAHDYEQCEHQPPR